MNTSRTRRRSVNAEGAAAVPSSAPATTSLAALLSRHILRDGEIVILLLKPSLWFVLLASLRFAAVALLLMAAAHVFDDHISGNTKRLIIEVGIFLILARLMWAVLQWTSRLYVLTDLRIISIAGVFNAQVFDCPLRKVARTRLIAAMSERLLRLGSIEIIPVSDDAPEGIWQTVSRPRQVHEQIVAAINKSKQGGCLT